MATKLLPTFIYIFDTNCFIANPQCYQDFKGELVIPMTVLEELDKLKTKQFSGARNCRVAIRKLDELCETGDISKGIKIGKSSTLRVDVSNSSVVGSDATYADNKIVSLALSLKKKNASKKVVVVSRDINLKIKARSLGLEAQGYDNDNKDLSDLYMGWQNIVNESAGIELYDKGFILIKDYIELDSLNENECVLFGDLNKKGIAPGIRTGDKISLVKERTMWNINAKNKEQLFASELIYNSDIPLVSLIGKAGSGKTLLSVGAALDLVLNKRKYDNLIIYKPIQEVGNPLGYLPGTISEKVSPYFASIEDSFSFLLNGGSGKKEDYKKQLHQYLSNGTIQFEALAFIRGRSISRSLILIDEAQNLGIGEIKTILTRVGYGSKIILTGDIEQIDNDKLDALNNGLTYVIEKLKTSELTGHITLTKGERSELSALAAELL